MEDRKGRAEAFVGEWAAAEQRGDADYLETALADDFAMAHVRGRVVERWDDEAAWEVIDRISRKYTGGPYAVRTDRMLYLIEPDHTWAWAAG